MLRHWTAVSQIASFFPRENTEPPPFINIWRAFRICNRLFFARQLNEFQNGSLCCGYRERGGYFSIFVWFCKCNAQIDALSNCLVIFFDLEYTFGLGYHIIYSYLARNHVLFVNCQDFIADSSHFLVPGLATMSLSLTL